MTTIIYLACVHCGRAKNPDREQRCSRCKSAYICKKNAGRIRRATLIHYTLIEKPKEQQP